MTRTPLLLTLVAAAALAGCNKEDHTIIAGPPGDDNSTVNLASVQLPPSITATKTYRCKDNSVVRIDWLSDGTARVHAKGDDVGKTVQVGDAGPLKGAPTDSSVSYNGMSCNS